MRRSIDQSVLAAATAALNSAQQGPLIAGALSELPWLVLIPILGFFLLKDAASFRRIVVIALPRETKLRGYRLVEELDTTLAAYVRAQLLGCLIVGGLCGLGFAILGVPYPVPLGVVAGLLEFIPIVGPLLLALVAALVSALHAPVLVFWVIGFLGVLRVVEDYMIYPRPQPAVAFTFTRWRSSHDDHERLGQVELLCHPGPQKGADKAKRGRRDESARTAAGDRFPDGPANSGDHDQENEARQCERHG